MLENHSSAKNMQICINRCNMFASTLAGNAKIENEISGKAISRFSYI